MAGSFFVKKSIAYILSASVFIAGFTLKSSVFADSDIRDSKSRLEDINSELENTKDKIEKNESNIAKTEREKESLNNQIVQLNIQCSDLQNEAEKLNQQISLAEKEYKKLKESSIESIELFKKRLKSIYMADDTTYLEILVGAKSFSDCLDKLDFLNTVSQFDRNIVDSLKNDMNVITKKRSGIEASKHKLEQKNKELSDKQKKLKELVYQSQLILDDLHEEHNTLSCILDENNEEMQKIEKEIEKYYENQRKKAEEEKRKQEELKNQMLLEQDRLQNSDTDSESVSGDEDDKNISSDTENLPDSDTESDSILNTDSDNNSDDDNINDKNESEDKSYAWPCPGFYYLSSEWNEDRGSYNHGAIDIAGYGIYGAPVVAANSGIVFSTANYCPHDYGKEQSCGCGGGYGNYVMIDHGDGKSTVYAHMSRTAVTLNEYVKKGQIIGYVGSTGHSTGPHLHFETRLYNVKYNPMSEY